MTAARDSSLGTPLAAMAMTTNWVPTAEQLVDIRKQLGLEQKQMAKLLGLGVRNLRYKEKGEVPITVTDGRAVRDIAREVSLLRLGIPIS